MAEGTERDPRPAGTEEPAEVTTAFGTVIVERPEEPPARKQRRRSDFLTPRRVLLGFCLVGFAVLCVVQLVNLPSLLDPAQVLTAGRARPMVATFGVAVIALIGAAALLPERLLHVPVAAAAAFVALVLAATLTFGGQAWSFAIALLTMSACWVVGRWVLLALRMPGLAAMAPIAWLAGSTDLGLFLLGLGRVGFLRWWTAGFVVAALGVVGVVRVGRMARPFAATIRKAVTESRLASASAALILLLLGLAAIWTAAPELTFDALYSKAWLPAEWARTGEIFPLRDHVILNLYGFGQLLAIPGHLFGADAVGRYIQWLAVASIPASLWWFLRPRTEWAPLVAALVAITPMLFWEATTAYDDALLVLAAVAFAQAVIVLLDRPGTPSLLEGIVVGVLAGGCLDLKLNMGWLVLGLLLGYAVLRAWPRLAALAGLLGGALASAGAPLLLRWSDIGDPVYPALLGVFHSPYLAPAGPIATRSGEGGGKDLHSPIRALWDSVTSTGTLFHWPVGTFGVLVLAVLGAVVVGVVARGRPGGRGLVALSAALALGAVGWYAQLKGPRYILPLGVVGVMALGLAARGQRLTRWSERTGLIALAVLAVLFWPATLAQFWNVPGKDLPLAAALGVTKASDYERQAEPERSALDAFNAESPPGAVAVSDATQRAWLSGGRDLQMVWELHDRLQLHGAHLPTSAEEGLRRIQGLGTQWALVNDSRPRLPGLYYLYGTIARFGELRWADRSWTLFRLTDHPRAPTAIGACDDSLSGASGCWSNGIDGRPGYTSRDGAPQIHRPVTVCPGELLTLDLSTQGRGLAGAAIDFNGPDPARGHVTPIVAGNTTARVGGTAPPGATRATVTLTRPGPGLKISFARLGRVGGCPA